MGTPPDPEVDPPVAVDAEGFVFGDRSMLPDPGEAPAGDEVVGLRTATSSTFETSIPGVLLTRESPVPVNTPDGDGGFEPIDPTLQPADSGEGGFTNTSDRVAVTVADTADAEVLAAVTLPAGASVGYGLEGAAPVEAQVEGATATFEGVFDGVDVVLESRPGGIKETLVLGSPAAVNEFTYDLDVTGLAASTAPDGTVVFTNTVGRAKLGVPPGFMVDATGATSTAVGYTLAPDGTALVVTADPVWLADPERVFPVAVDPTLSVVADTDDTTITQGSTADRSAELSLEVGFDGTDTHRGLLHFTGPTTMANMNVMAADLALYQSGAGSCAATPVDVYAATEAWEGATVTWPGPTLADTAAATISSGKGHNGSCAAGSVGVDLTRQVDAWVQGEVPSLGIALRARNETDPTQHKVFASADDVPGTGQPDRRPVINVLWSDPTAEGAPSDPSGLAPEGRTASFQPSLEATYVDAEGDDGYVVFFGYLADTGAFTGAIVSPTVESNATATAVPQHIGLDVTFTWRALAVDAVNGLASPLSRHVELIHPSVAIVEPSTGEVVEGDLTVAVEVDPSITDASALALSVDGSAIASTDPPGGEMIVSSHDLAEGPRTLTATVTGGGHHGATSPPVGVYVDNSDTDSEPYPRGPTLRRTLGVVDDVHVGGQQYLPRNPVDSGGGDCGWSERLPDGNTLWLICDRTANGLIDSVAGLAPSGSPTKPVWRAGRFLGTPPACPTIDQVAPGLPFRWMTGVASFPVPASPGYGPQDDTMVVIFFHQGCRDSTYKLEPGDTGYFPGTAGVATYRYHHGTPVSELDGTGQEASTLGEAQIRNSSLWLGTIGNAANRLERLQVMHGTGAVYVAPQSGDTTGYLYAYGCKPGRIDLHIPAYGRCNVARAPANATNIGALGDRTTWSYWNGTGWTACAGTCTDTQMRDALVTQQAMRLPNPNRTYRPPHPCPDGYPPECPQAYRVPQHFEVTYSPQLGLFLAAHQIVFKQRHMSMVVRAASSPTGPWSDPLEVPINCDGRTRQRPTDPPPRAKYLNCYQLAAHPQLSGTASGNVVFHYYDHFRGSWSESHPNTEVESRSLRFVSVPLCAESSDGGTPVGYVVSRCLMTGSTGSGWSGGLSRIEAAAVVWRLGGYRWRNPNTASNVVRRRNRESVTYFLTSPKGFTTVWSTATALTVTTPTTRAELIRLLWRLAGAPSATYPIEALDDYDPSWGGQLQGALRWAFANGIVCNASFQPQATATRGTTAQWVYRAHARVRCDL